MNTLTIICLTACMVMASGFKLQRDRRAASEHFIKYLKQGRDTDIARDTVSQTIVIQDGEVKLSNGEGMDAVIDYNQNMLFVKRENDKSCIAISSKNIIIPSLETIRDMVKLSTSTDTPIQFPSLTIELDLIKSTNQEQPELSPLSKELCGGNVVVVVEQKPEETIVQTAMALHELRPKRDVGWGEVVLIIIVIIILF